MDLTGGFGVRSTGGSVPCREELGFESLATLPPENASFTALLELPATQALELLHFSDSSSSQAVISEIGGDTFMERAARYSVIGNDQQNGNISEETPTSSVNAILDRVKTEPAENSDPTMENQIPNFQRKRKDFEKKVKTSTKKKTKSSEDTEKLPYVHVRARRGQATDSHSLAERARREKINIRMKLLQELVPGCDKIQGTALVLDEIINHVQSLQRQVEMLSMRLAAVNPRIDFNLSTILSSENGSLMDGSFNSNAMQLAWPNQVIETEQSFHQLQLQPPQPQQWLNQPVWEREEDQTHSNLMAGSDNLNPNQVKMELP